MPTETLGASAWRPSLKQRLRWKRDAFVNSIRYALVGRALAFVRWTQRDSNSYRFAQTELSLLGVDNDGMQAEMNAGILTMVAVFGTQGHSGFSAGYARGILDKLLAFQPILPLTGNVDEWNEVGDGIFQNRRCGHVFKDETGVYDINGRVFREGGEHGPCYTSYESRVPVAFPYTPHTVIVDVPAPEGRA